MIGTARDLVRSAIIQAVSEEGHFVSEDRLQASIARVLGLNGKCEREVPAIFDVPALPPPQPPADLGLAIDVCKQRPLLDILTAKETTVAVELKYSQIQKWRGAFRGIDVSTQWSSDALPYEFLKDIHRMERLVGARSRLGLVNPEYRICGFLSSNPIDFEGRTPHDRMRLSTRTLQAGHLVQYNLTKAGGAPTSTNTLWKSYPPFYLERGYELRWEDLKNDVAKFERAPEETKEYPSYRLLLVEILSRPKSSVPVA